MPYKAKYLNKPISSQGTLVFKWKYTKIYLKDEDKVVYYVIKNVTINVYDFICSLYRYLKWFNKV